MRVIAVLAVVLGLLLIPLGSPAQAATRGRGAVAAAGSTGAVSATSTADPHIVRPTPRPTGWKFWVGQGYQVGYNVKTPWVAYVWLDKARTDDAMDGQMAGCAFFALVPPPPGPALGIACAVEAYLVKTTAHVLGMCAWFDVPLYNPTRPNIHFYKGGFCK